MHRANRKPAAYQGIYSNRTVHKKPALGTALPPNPAAYVKGRGLLHLEDEQLYEATVHPQHGTPTKLVLVHRRQHAKPSRELIALSDEDLSQRLREEYTLRYFRHHNILALHAVLVDNVDRLLVLDASVALWTVIHGLSNDVKQMKHLKLSQDASYIIRNVAQGLGYLHGNQIVHRAICSPNIRLCFGGRIVIYGFENASFFPQAIDPQDCPQIPAYYRPPKRTRRRYSVDADIWQLGILLLELTSGYPFVDGGKQMSAALMSGQTYAQASRHMPRNADPSTLCGKAAGEFLAMCLATRRRERPSARKLLSSAFLKGCGCAASVPRLTAIYELARNYVIAYEHPLRLTLDSNPSQYVYKHGGGSASPSSYFMPDHAAAQRLDEFVQLTHLDIYGYIESGQRRYYLLQQHCPANDERRIYELIQRWVKEPVYSELANMLQHRHHSSPLAETHILAIRNLLQELIESMAVQWGGDDETYASCTETRSSLLTPSYDLPQRELCLSVTLSFPMSAEAASACSSCVSVMTTYENPQRQPKDLYACHHRD
ncbi:serine/threonine-protein kinase PAK 1-like protein [Aphelenchoides avenae]|nr:serine/threonine-protein kinase PAK 1-like protein [Aphelenchus avenae]